MQKYTPSATPTAKKTKHAINHRSSYSHAKLDAKKNQRRSEAEARQREYDSLTPKAKLAKLGKTGSTRQRARLEAILAKENGTGGTKEKMGKAKTTA